MIKLTLEQAQQIEDALFGCRPTVISHENWNDVYKARAIITAAIITAARAQEQAEQEPVGVVEGSSEWGIAGVLVAGVPIGTKLYTAPVRTKDLTDEELNALWHNTKGGWIGLFRAVIAADRENNK